MTVDLIPDPVPDLVPLKGGTRDEVLWTTTSDVPDGVGRGGTGL
jgi:hypothetical protein